jgi:hypothetical protein
MYRIAGVVLMIGMGWMSARDQRPAGIDWKGQLPPPETQQTVQGLHINLMKICCEPIELTCSERKPHSSYVVWGIAAYRAPHQHISMCGRCCQLA